MRIAPNTAYTQSIQIRRQQQPSFNAINRNFSRDFMEYMKPKNYDKLPPMENWQKVFLATVPPACVLALVGIFATCTSFCHEIGVCLGKY